VAYRNAAAAFIFELSEIRRAGSSVIVRGNETKELLARTVRIERPTERCITVPERRNDIAAAVAESMWVIAGRNDLAFLSQYLPRAADFSDDGGLTWRAGYGPRLRNWEGVDQIAEVLSLLRRDPESRRAVIGLYDPARDFVQKTNDIPCNNWLHFLIRDGRLEMNIVVRSNDVLWGFSGINTFEWSVLHEMMAFWLGVEVGDENFFISSLHLYERHYARADKILDAYPGTTGYDKGWIQSSFSTTWDDFPSVLAEWFAIEADLAATEDVSARIASFPDPLLRQFLQVIELSWAKKRELPEELLSSLVDSLGHSDLGYAATEDLYRNSRDLPNLLPPRDDDFEGLRLGIARLHRSKDESYRDAWKRRGEQISIASNLARKVDRIEAVAAGANPNDESLLDTVVDLYVYCLKYQTYLADQEGSIARELFGENHSVAFSDGPEGFEALLPQQHFGLTGNSTLQVAAQQVVSDFDSLDTYLRAADPLDWQGRVPLLQKLTASALRLLLVDTKIEPVVVAEFIAQWTADT
jgi:thymidylate synthase